MHTNRFQSISQSKAPVLLIVSATQPLILQPDSIHPLLLTYPIFTRKRKSHPLPKTHLKKRKKSSDGQFTLNSIKIVPLLDAIQKSETLLFSNIYSKWDCLFGLNKMLWSAICTFCQKMTDDAKHTSTATLRCFAIKTRKQLFIYKKTQE